MEEERRRRTRERKEKRTAGREDINSRFNRNTAEPDENRIEGRNAVIEAYRAGRTIEKLYLLEGPAEGAMQTVLRLAKEKNTPVRFVTRQRLDQLSQTGKHQGVIAQAAAFHYAQIEELFEKAAAKGEDPFFILLDQIEDPHNLGAIIRTANLAGAHGVIIPKDRAAGLTATAAKAGGTEAKRPVVCLRGYGWNADDQAVHDRSHRPGHRIRGQRREPARKRKMRYDSRHSHERGDRFPECVCCRRYPDVRDPQAEGAVVTGYSLDIQAVWLVPGTF